MAILWRAITVLFVATWTFTSSLSTPSAAALVPRDTAAENALQGTSDWKLGPVAGEAELSGYAHAESFLPGDQVELRVNSPGRPVTIDVYRLGHYSGLGGRLVTSVTQQPGITQPDCTVSDLRMVDCSSWSVTHTIDTTGWTPGIHLAKLRNDAGREKYVPIILASPKHTGTVTVVSATSTHQAYNAFGRYSLYKGPSGTSRDRAHELSFNRPYSGNGAHKIMGYEAGLIQHLESLGEKLSYSTSFRLEGSASQFAKSAALVFLGHDEYWSTRMRQTAEVARDSGTNLVFLGANNMYWRIRWSADGKKITGYKDAALDPVKDATSTTTFREFPGANPEAGLLGSQYACMGASTTQLEPLVVTDPDFWPFAGTGVRRGQKIDKLVGHEIDQVTPESPKNVVVGARSPYACTTGASHSDFTYYTAPSGAGVINAGTFGLNYALSPNPPAPGSVPFAKGVVSTIVKESAKGPLSKRHPVTTGQPKPTPPSTSPSEPPVRPSPAPPETSSPADIEKDPQLLYVSEGEHLVNGRRWKTSCEPYSQTQRCRTEIWATSVIQRRGRFVSTNGWTFNNLTYLPMPRAIWGDNRLANTGTWSDENGRSWRTECGTPLTGSDGCRTWVRSSVIKATRTFNGTYAHAWGTDWVMNNMVRHLR